MGPLEVILDYERGEPGRVGFEGAVRRRLAPLADRLGWAPKRGEPTAVTKLRPDVLALLGRARHPETLEEVRRRWNAFLKAPGSLSAELRDVVLGLTGRYGLKDDFDALLALARATEDVEARSDYLYALGNTLDPVLAKRALALTLERDMDPTIAMSLLRRVGYEHPVLVRSFLQANAAQLLAGRPAQDRAEAITGAYRGFYDVAAADELEAYAKGQVPEEAWNEIKKASTRIRLDAAVKARLLPAFDAWAREPF
jgi:aminopeptidase N